MKPTIAILTVLFLSFSVYAKNPETANYIQTKSGVLFGKKVVQGILYTKCVMPDGSFWKIKNKEVLSYKNEEGQFDMLNGFELQNLGIENGFKKLLAVKDGFYLYEAVQVRPDANEQLVEKPVYLVYKGGKFIVAVAAKNMENYWNVFGKKAQ